MMINKALHLAGASLNQTPLDWEENFKNIIDAIDQARKAHVDLVCLPELCITGYGCEDLFLSDWIYDKSLKQLEKVIPYCENISVVVGLPFKFEGINYNVAAYIKNRVIKGIYAKQNMALDGVHYEPRWFQPWPVGKKEVITIAGKSTEIGDIIIHDHDLRIGFEICEDAWRQDRPALRLVKRGIDMIVNPSASHFAFNKTIDREELIVNSSKRFDCLYLYANLLGNEAGRMIYDGEILIANKGQLLQRNNWLSFKKVNLTSVRIDRATEEATSPLETHERTKEIEFVKASSLALFDYLRKSRSQGFVLSLSGGADSSTIAILVCEMVKRGIMQLGFLSFLNAIHFDHPEKEINDTELQVKFVMKSMLTCAYQGTKNSSNATLEAAQKLAEEIGATFHHWTIDLEVDGYTRKVEKALGRGLTWQTDDITLQNIQARARSPIIWMFANINNALLLTTSNRSEGDVGYTTMDGDTSGSLAPIAAVDKDFIIKWLKWAEKNLGYPSLNYVNNLQPTAELRPLDQAQTDEKDLMPYSIMVEIERLAIRDHRSPLEAYLALKEKIELDTTLLKTYIRRFYTLWSRNQWKRERIAPAFHLDEFNVDPRTWCRFPILSHGFKDELDLMEKAD